MARRKRRVRQRKKPRVRKRAPARKTRVRPRPRARKRPAKKEVSYNPLMALIMFLYMLRLIDEKTVTRIQQALYPTKKPERKPRTRRKRRR